MYAYHNTMRELAKMEDDPRPIIYAEYAHAMGNSSGHMDTFVNLFREYPRFSGGFIWDWIDQGLEETDEYGQTYYAYGGDYGEEISDNSFLANGLLYSDRTPQPSLYAVKEAYQPVRISSDGYGQPVLESFLTHTNLDQYDLVLRYVSTFGTEELHRARAPSVGPGEMYIVSLDSLFQLNSITEQAEVIGSISFYEVALVQRLPEFGRPPATRLPLARCKPHQRSTIITVTVKLSKPLTLKYCNRR